MKRQKRVLAAALCAAMLLLCGCSGQENNLKETQSQVEDTVSSVSQTASTLETDTKTQPVQQEVSQTSSAASQPKELSSASQATPSAQPEVETTPVAYQHSFHDIGTVGTCSTPGQHIYECTKCGYTEYGDIIPPEHFGKYACEYCGVPLPEYPFEGLNVWLEDTAGGNWIYEDTLGSFQLTPYLFTELGDVTVYYFTADGSKWLDFTLYQNGAIRLSYSDSNGNMSGTWNCSEIDHNFPMRFAQQAVSDPQAQQRMAEGLNQTLNSSLEIFRQLVSRFGFTLSTYGFTAW